MSEDFPLLPPSLTQVPGVSPALLEGIFAAAADFYSLSPWGALGGETNIAVHIPSQSEARLVVVMGAGGQVYGVSVYDSAADLQRMYRLDDPLAAAAEISWLALTYETAEYMSADDRWAIERFGWRVANPSAYPAIVRIGAPGPELRPPQLDDLVWLEGALRSLCLFVEHYLEMDERGAPRPALVNLKSTTSAGQMETRLRLPGLRV